MVSLKMLLYLILIALPAIWASRLPTCADNNCFHQPAEACPEPDDPDRCKTVQYCDTKAVICCDLNKDSLYKEIERLDITEFTALHIRNATLKSIDAIVRRSRNLTSLSITDGNIERIDSEFFKLTKMSCLNLSSNSIMDISNRSLSNLYNLKILDLSHNNLTYIPLFKRDGYITLDVSDNKRLQCINLSKTIKRHGLTFRNENETTCLSPRNFHWFNTTELVSLSEVERLLELDQNCTIKNCSCAAHRLDIVAGQPATFAVRVNCAGKHLTALPSPLPPNTIVLNVSNNNITDLDPISGDSSYENLRELYADNNSIASILPLEGSKFISNFVALSLRNNKLRSLPTYVMSNTFDRNNLQRYFFLGQNKLDCDCNTAKLLKDWLLTKVKYIPDNEELYCINMKMKVIELDPKKLCQTPVGWTDYIYYIITLEVLLLVFLIAKVSYDYWVFKTAGYLPWPASQIPRLPCDWLCE